MQEPSSFSSSPLLATFSSTVHHTGNTLLSPRHIAYMAGATLLFFVIIVMFFEDSAASPEQAHLNVVTTNGQVPVPNEVPSQETITPQDPTTSTVSPISSSSQSTANTKLSVNGQNIPLPANSTTTQTVPGSNGSETTVHASSSASQSANSSSSNLTVDVHSVSSGTVP